LWPAARRKKTAREEGGESDPDWLSLKEDKRSDAVAVSRRLRPPSIMDLLNGLSDDDALSLMQQVLKHEDDDR
jgi:hypothetical protein